MTSYVYIIQDIVICCNPGIEPSALLHLLRELRSAYKVLCTCYTHSSSKSSPCKDLTKCGFVPNLVGESRAENDIVITWIWKDCKYKSCLTIELYFCLMIRTSQYEACDSQVVVVWALN